MHFRSDDLNYLYTVYRIHLRNLGIDPSLMERHEGYEDADNFLFERSICPEITGGVDENEKKNNIADNIDFIDIDLIQQLIIIEDKLLGVNFYNKLFNSTPFSKDLTKEQKNQLWREVNGPLQERFPGQKINDVFYQFSEEVVMKLTMKIAEINAQPACAHHKLLQLLQYLEYFDKIIDCLRENHWFKKIFFELEKQSRSHPKLRKFQAFAASINNGLHNIGATIGNGITEFGSSIAESIRNARNWIAKFFCSEREKEKEELAKIKDELEKKRLKQAQQEVNNKTEKYRFMAGILINLALEIQNFATNKLTEIIFCEIPKQELFQMTSAPENPTQYDGVVQQLQDTAVSIKHIFAQEKLRAHVQNVLFDNIEQIKELTLQKKDAFGEIFSHLVQIDSDMDWGNFQQKILRKCKKKARVTSDFLQMLEKSKRERSIGNAFAIFFQTPLNIISGKSLANIYKKQPKKEKKKEEKPAELSKNAGVLQKVGHKVKTKWIKFKHKTAEGWQNFKEKIKKAFSSEKDSIAIRYKETLKLLSKKFNITVENMRKIFTTYGVFIFVIPATANVTLLVVSIFFPIPWIVSVVIIGISIPLYANIAYFIGCFLSSFAFNLDGQKIDAFAKDCQSLHENNPELFDVFIDLWSLNREDFAKSVQELIDMRVEKLQNTNMDFMNPDEFATILREEQQKLMNYLMDLYDKTQRNPLENDDLLQQTARSNEKTHQLSKLNAAEETQEVKLFA